MCDIYPGPNAPTEVKYMTYGHRPSTLGATGCSETRPVESGPSKAAAVAVAPTSWKDEPCIWIRCR